MHQGLKVEQMLEIGTVFNFNPVQRQAQFLKFRSINSLNKLAKVVHNTHAFQLKHLQVLKSENKTIHVAKCLFISRPHSEIRIQDVLVQNTCINCQLFQ